MLFFIFDKRKEIYIIKKRISDEDEVKLYYIICDISNACKSYFYDRKYLPKDWFSVDGVVQDLYVLSKSLKNKYNEIRKNMK